MENCRIKNSSAHAADIADTNNVCGWNQDNFGVDMKRPGAQAYYNSVFELIASWGVDFVKVDDLSRPYHTAEIEAIRVALDRTGRPIVFSTSPGATPLEDGSHIIANANQRRISDDFWDKWSEPKKKHARLEGTISAARRVVSVQRTGTFRRCRHAAARHDCARQTQNELHRR